MPSLRSELFHEAVALHHHVARLEGEKGYLELADRSRIGVTIQRHQRILYVNPIAAAIFGDTPEALRGRSTVDFIPESERDYFVEQRERLLAGEIAQIFEPNRPLRRLDGTELRTRITAIRIDFDGEPAVLGIGVELKTPSEPVADQAEETFSRVAMRIAHDAGNFLYVIAMIADLIDADPEATPEKLRGYASEIRQAADRATELTQRLARLDEPGDAVAIDVNETLVGLRALLEQAVAPRVSLRLELDADAGSIRAPIRDLERVLLNLCLNAREAMPEGGELSIATRAIRSGCQPGAVVLTVRDTGVGMDAETLRRATEEAFSTKEARRPRGQGLAIVQRIAASLGGTLELESEPGRGATVRVVLPAIDP